MKNEAREVVLIAGIGHSGTSLCSNTVSKSGYPIPSKEITSKYEIPKIRNINENGARPKSIKNYMGSGFKVFGNKLSIKDPRFARDKVIIRWSDVISQLGGKTKWIFCFRNPTDYIDSMKVQHPEAGLIKRYVQAAEFGLFHKRKFLFLDYDLNKTKTNVLCLRRYLNLSFTPKNLYDVSMHHFETKSSVSKSKQYPGLERLYHKMCEEQQKSIGRMERRYRYV